MVDAYEVPKFFKTIEDFVNYSYSAADTDSHKKLLKEAYEAQNLTFKNKEFDISQYILNSGQYTNLLFVNDNASNNKRTFKTTRIRKTDIENILEVAENAMKYNYIDLDQADKVREEYNETKRTVDEFFHDYDFYNRSGGLIYLNIEPHSLINYMHNPLLPLKEYQELGVAKIWNSTFELEELYNKNNNLDLLDNITKLLQIVKSSPISQYEKDPLVKRVKELKRRVAPSFMASFWAGVAHSLDEYAKEADKETQSVLERS